MKANEKSILRFLESSDTSYLIPIYQRVYSWGIEEAKNLFDDLLMITKLEKKHFFGSIVTLYNSASLEKEYIIIDGQQRLITITLLLIALFKSLKNINMNKDQSIYNLIENCIVNKTRIYQYSLKLKLKKQNQEEFQKLYELDDEEISYSSSMINNYKYFLERIKKSEITIENLLNSISKLYIVDIELILGEDNPQLIFESLNSTGQNLNTADKIRNYIFMNLTEKDQTEYYRKYWTVIEENTKNDLEDFIIKYLYIKNINLMENDLYKSFKMYANNSNMKQILGEIKEYSYGYINLKKNKNKKLALYIENVYIMDKGTIDSFLLEVLKDYHKGYFTEYDVLGILEVLENYIFRRMICGLSNKNISRFLLDTLNIVKRQSEYTLVELFKSFILAEKDTLRYPNFIEFKKSFLQSDLYRLGSKKIIFIFEKIENYDNKEIINFENLISSKQLSIEHIMPQRLNREWKRTLGEDYKRIHDEYLHTVGNLTLTGYNSNMGNKSFQEKCTISKGFKQSRLLINKYITKQYTWNEKQIIERAILLFNIILKIFPDLQSKIKLQNEGIKMKSLDEYYNYSNSKIKGFIFEGVTYNSRSYKEMFNIVISLLYDMDNLIFIKIASKITSKEQYIDNELIELYKIPTKFTDANEFLEYLYSANIKNNKRILILKNLFELLNLNCESLVLYIN